MRRGPLFLLRRTAIARSAGEPPRLRSSRGSACLDLSFGSFAASRPGFESTAKGTRSFCPRCGTQLTFEHEDFFDEIDVTTCNLDDPDWAPSRDPYEQRAQLGQTVLINHPNIKKVGRKGDHCEASSRLSWKAGRYFRFSRRVG